jgi:hypothetical protein
LIKSVNRVIPHIQPKLAMRKYAIDGPVANSKIRQVLIPRGRNLRV